MPTDPLEHATHLVQNMVPAPEPGYLRRIFLKPGGGLNWRTIGLVAAGGVAGAFIPGYSYDAGFAGIAAGAAGGLAVGAGLEYFLPSLPPAPETQQAGGPPGGTQVMGQGLGQQLGMGGPQVPQGLPPRVNNPQRGV